MGGGVCKQINKSKTEEEALHHLFTFQSNTPEGETQDKKIGKILVIATRKSYCQILKNLIGDGKGIAIIPPQLATSLPTVKSAGKTTPPSPALEEKRFEEEGEMRFESSRKFEGREGSSSSSSSLNQVDEGNGSPSSERFSHKRVFPPEDCLEIALQQRNVEIVTLLLATPHWKELISDRFWVLQNQNRYFNSLVSISTPHHLSGEFIRIVTCASILLSEGLAPSDTPFLLKSLKELPLNLEFLSYRQGVFEKYLQEVEELRIPLEELIENILKYKHQSDVIDVVDTEGNTPLHIATSANCEPVMRILLNFQANPNTQNKSKTYLHHRHKTPVHEGGETPLHLAAEKGAIDCVRCLLEFNSQESIRIQNAKGLTPLHCFASYALLNRIPSPEALKREQVYQLITDSDPAAHQYPRSSDKKNVLDSFKKDHDIRCQWSG